MEVDLQKAAAEGKFDPFEEHLDHLDCIVTCSENTILHFHLSLLSERSTEFIKQVVGNCPKLLTQENRDGNTPLHIAARHGHTDVAEELIRQAEALHGDNKEAVREMLRKENKMKETALHVAARNGRSLGVVKAILSKEDHEFKYPANEFGETPLDVAVDNTCTYIVAELLNSQSLDLEYGDSINGATVLHRAVGRWNTEVVRMLLEKQSSLSKTQNHQGQTPLHIAASEGSSSIVATLLDKDKSIACSGADLWSVTALHIAALKGFKHVVKEITSKCPECCKLTDRSGWNVLHYAVFSENDEVLEAILENSSLVDLISGKDNGGNTPVHLFKAFNLPLPSFILDGDTDAFILWKKLYNTIPRDFTMKDLAKGIPYFENLTMADEEIKDETAEFAYSWDVSTKIKILAKNKINNIMKRSLKKKAELMIAKSEEARDSNLIPAALVATVTFAAGFTLPGGYISDKNDSEKGTSILSRNSAFKAFIIADTIAMVLSTSSVFIYFIMVLLGHRPKYYWLIKIAFRFIILAMGAMVVAFVMGTYAVLTPSLVMTAGFLHPRTGA
ncbi:hypothetical protein MANES_14G152400v8 [Manihot esculenta]|uniref:PGG domain-containing protein n=1 Tax=Manihot esculenta TaxID=3983 RepID=A0A2C9ULV6_MANES|nr:hypothetical protein MANES_14G152400v8 [Manihot esculenta]